MNSEPHMQVDQTIIISNIIALITFSKFCKSLENINCKLHNFMVIWLCVQHLFTLRCKSTISLNSSSIFKSVSLCSVGASLFGWSPFCFLLSSMRSTSTISDLISKRQAFVYIINPYKKQGIPLSTEKAPDTATVSHSTIVAQRIVVFKSNGVLRMSQIIEWKARNWNSWDKKLIILPNRIIENPRINRVYSRVPISRC